MLYRDDAAVLSPRCGFCVLLGSRVTILMLDTEEGRGATSRRGRTGRVSLVNEGSQQSSFSVGKAAPGEKISAARGAGASDLLCLGLGRLATSRRGGCVTERPPRPRGPSYAAQSLAFFGRHTTVTTNLELARTTAACSPLGEGRSNDAGASGM